MNVRYKKRYTYHLKDDIVLKMSYQIMTLLWRALYEKII